MKKKYVNSSLITIIFSLVILATGCMNLQGSSIPAETPAVKEKTVKLRVSVDDYELDADYNRTILPAVEDGTTIERFVLEGLQTKNSMGVIIQNPESVALKEWTSYREMHSAVIEVLPGTWNFTLKCYKSESGTQKLFASGRLNNRFLKFTDEGETPTLLNFDISYDTNQLTTGKCSIKVNVPENQLNHAKISMYKYEGNVKNPHSLTKTDYIASNAGADSGYQCFIINEANIPNGYYFVEIQFFTDETLVPTATRIEYIKIAGGQTSTAELTYDEINLRYKVTFQRQLPDEEPVTMPADFTYNNSTVVALQPAVADHYDFKGWYETSDYTGTEITQWTAGDKTSAVNLYAKWEAKTYAVNLYDFAGGQSSGKTYSGNVFATTLIYGSELPAQTDIQISDPNTTQYNDYDNVLYFAGWYKEPSCENLITLADYNALQDLDTDGTTDTFVLYAKWNYKYVFVKPSTGADTNTGASANEPLASITEVKNYLEKNPYAEKVYVQSGLDIVTNNPSGLSTPKFNNVIVEGYYSYTGHIISVSTTGEYELHDVTIDGGAVWGEDGAAGVNNGRSATIALITLYTNKTPKAILNLNDNVILQNNQNIDGSNLGGAIRNYDIVKVNSESVIIRANATTNQCGGGIHIGGGASLYLNKGIIGGTDPKDGNYASSGGAIGVSYHTATANIFVGTEGLSSTDRSDILIMNNSAKYGGAVYISESSATVKNATIKNNSAIYSSGGAMHGEVPTSSQSVYFENCLLSHNSAVTQGGAINVSVPLFIDNCEIAYNSANTGGGGGGAVFINKTTATISNSVFSYNEHKTKLGGAITVSTESTLVLSDSTFEHNKAATFGGAIYAGSTSSSTNDTSTTITNCTFTENESLQEGGAISIRTNAASGYKNILSITDSTFTKNKALEKGGAINSDGINNEINLKNVLLEENKIETLTPNTGKDFYTNSQNVNLDGKIYLGNSYFENSMIKLLSPLTKYSDKSKIMTVGIPDAQYPTTSYDASDSSTYVQILTEDSGAGYIASSYNLFGVEKTGYTINDLGRIRFDPLTAINAGFDFNLPSYTATELTFIVEPSVSAGTLTATAAGGYTTYHWIFDGEILAPNTATLSLNVSSKPAGYYDLLVIAKNNDSDVAVATKTVHIVKELNAGGVVPLENLSAYLASLPAGEHNISMVADMSDADNVQALSDALKANPNVIVNLDLSNAAFTKFGQGSVRTCFDGVKNLKSVLLPATVKSISEHAFYGCGLSSIVIPSSVTSIGSYAFYYCIHLKSIVFEDVSSNWTNPVGEIHKFTADAQENGFFLMYDRNSWTKN